MTEPINTRTSKTKQFLRDIFCKPGEKNLSLNNIYVYKNSAHDAFPDIMWRFLIVLPCFCFSKMNKGLVCFQ